MNHVANLDKSLSHNTCATRRGRCIGPRWIFRFPDYCVKPHNSLTPREIALALLRVSSNTLLGIFALEAQLL
jgi:hypothetical protein